MLLCFQSWYSAYFECHNWLAELLLTLYNLKPVWPFSFQFQYADQAIWDYNT